MPCVSCHAGGDTTRPQDDPPSLTTDERLLLVLCRLLGGFWLWLEERRTTLHLETKGGLHNVWPECWHRLSAVGIETRL